MWLKKEIIAFWNDEEGVTVIEIVLILVVKWSKDFLCVSCA